MLSITVFSNQLMTHLFVQLLRHLQFGTDAYLNVLTG